MLGGTMRQVGILAAAGLYALEHNVERLAEDHANAARLAAGLAGLGLKVEPVQTNMVFVAIDKAAVSGLSGHLASSGINALVSPRMRIVTHLDLDAGAVDRVIDAFRQFFKAKATQAA
jgi:threonine aldolase